MPFGTITSQSLTYQPRAEGMYVLSTLSFSDPSNHFLMRGASKTDPLRASVSRVLQKDIVVGGETKRISCTVTLSVVTPSSGFTPAEIDSAATDLSTFITTDTISRLLTGEI